MHDLYDGQKLLGWMVAPLKDSPQCVTVHRVVGLAKVNEAPPTHTHGHTHYPITIRLVAGHSASSLQVSAYLEKHLLS